MDVEGLPLSQEIDAMFKELFELVRASGPLTMAVSADAPRGTMTVVVIPKPADAKDEPALATPLSLTATPEEFDAEFTTVLAGYRTQRLSLAEQVAATNEVLAAAREASVQKGSKAATTATTATARTPVKHVAAPVAAPSAAAAGEEPDDDDSDTAQAPVTGAGAVTAATSESARAGAPDLFG